MKKVNPSTYFEESADELIEAAIRALHSDRPMADLIQSLAMTDEEIHLHLSTLLAIQHDQKDIAQCVAQQQCQKPNGHYQVTLTRNAAGYLERQMTPCPMLTSLYTVQRYLLFDDFPDVWKDGKLFDDVGKRQHRLALHKVLLETFLKEAKQRKNAFIYGPPNSGKSFSLATFAYKFALNERGTIGMVQASTLSQQCLDGQFQDRDVWQRVWDRLHRCDVLIVDRLGDETSLDKSRDVLWIPLFQKRLQEKQTTFVISSFSLDDLGVLYAPFPSQKPKAKQLIQLLSTFEHQLYIEPAAAL